MSQFTLRSACCLVAGLIGFTLAATTPAVADPIDGQLIKHSRELRDFCLKNRYDAVGILSFRLKMGDEAPSFRGGTIIQSLPERLEYALIMSLQAGDKELNIAHNASSTATKSLGNANYRTTEERKKLFTVSYPQAWGSPRPQIKLDAFLTGKVSITEDLRTAKVEIESFDRRNPTVVRDVLSFEVPVDRYILADAGKGFSLSAVTRGKFTRSVTDDDIIESTGAAADDTPSAGPAASTTTTTPAKPKATTSTTANTATAKPATTNTATTSTATTTPSPAVKAEPKLNLAGAIASAATLAPATSTSRTVGFPVEVTLYYSNVKQTLTPDEGLSGLANYSVRTPREGESLEIGVKNLTGEKLGMVLCVNGRSTLYEKKGQPDSLDRWALEPNSEYVIRGYFQADNATYKPITALSESESSRQFSDLGGDESAGLIQVYIYRNAPKPVDVAVATPKADKPKVDATETAKKTDLGEIKNSAAIRRFSEEELAESATGSLSQLQDLIVPGKLDFTRGLFASGWGDTRREKLTAGTLGEVQLTDAMVIRYYTKK